MAHRRPDLRSDCHNVPQIDPTPAPMKHEPSINCTRDQPTQKSPIAAAEEQASRWRWSFVSKCQALVPVDQARSPNGVTKVRGSRPVPCRAVHLMMKEEDSDEQACLGSGRSCGKHSSDSGCCRGPAGWTGRWRIQRG